VVDLPRIRGSNDHSPLRGRPQKPLFAVAQLGAPEGGAQDNDRVSRLRGVLLLIVGIAIGLVTGLVVAGGESRGSCARAEVRVDDHCARPRAGKPIDRPYQTKRVAEQAIDADPGPGQFRSTDCAFRGVAAREYDVYRCRIEYWDTKVVMRLVHDRRIAAYRYEIVRTTNPRIVPLTHGVCDWYVARYC